MSATTTAAPATTPQVSFVQSLLLSRDIPADFAERVQACLAAGMTKTDASAAITYMKARPSAAPAAATGRFDPQTLEVGLYELGDTIYKVKNNRAGTRVYAEVLTMSVGEAQRLTATGATIKAKYEFQGHDKLALLRPEMRITGERAKELTVIFSSCIVCGAHLKAAQSVERGIGPVCFGKI